MQIPDGSKSFDRETMLERMGGDIDLLEEVIELFLEDSPGMMQTVREAVAGQDPNHLERSAHSIKGALLNMAADPAAGVAHQLEQMGRDENMDSCQEVLTILEAEVEQLNQELKDLQC